MIFLAHVNQGPSETPDVFLVKVRTRYCLTWVHVPHYIYTEAEYAFQKNKTIIPLKVDDDFEPSGWLGPLIGTRLYYRMDTDELLRRNFPDLLRAMGDRGRYSDDVDFPGKMWDCGERRRNSDIVYKPFFSQIYNEEMDNCVR